MNFMIILSDQGELFDNWGLLFAIVIGSTIYIGFIVCAIMEPVNTLKKMTKEEAEDHEYERINVEQESLTSEHEPWKIISSSTERV